MWVDAATLSNANLHRHSIATCTFTFVLVVTDSSATRKIGVKPGQGALVSESRYVPVETSFCPGSDGFNDRKSEHTFMSRGMLFTSTPPIAKRAAVSGLGCPYDKKPERMSL